MKLFWPFIFLVLSGASTFGQSSPQRRSNQVPAPSSQTPPPRIDINSLDKNPFALAMDTLTIVKAPGVLQERLDTLISRFGDSSSFVEPRADAPRSLCEAAELIEGSIHRLPFMTIRYATEYRGYYVLSYGSTNYWAAPRGVKVTGQDVKELFTEGWLLKKGEVKFRGFRLAEGEKSKE